MAHIRAHMRILLSLLFSSFLLNYSWSFTIGNHRYMSPLFRRNLSSLKVVKGVKGREIIDSRGNPTIEVDITTDLGIFTAPVPSGASTGIHEAHELRDKDPCRYLGKGVKKAIGHVNEIIGPKIMGVDPTHQEEVDQLMLKLDGTMNKQNLGANAILAVSLALSKAGAAQRQVPLYQYIADLARNNDINNKFILPTPCFNVINGGSHAGNKLAFQEYFVIPTGASSFAEAMQIGCEVYHNLARVLGKKYGRSSTMIGDEGGFAPPCDERMSLELIREAIVKAGHVNTCSVGLDVAASEFKIKGQDLYDLDFKSSSSDSSSSFGNGNGNGNGNGGGDDIILMQDKRLLTSHELSKFYDDLISDYPSLITIEDPFHEDDWKAWSKYNTNNDLKHNQYLKDLKTEKKTEKKFKNKLQIVADDITVTNPVIIQKGINENIANCLLLKLNQIGTLTESIQAVKLANKNQWNVMTSHRSGETEDSYIADLSVGLCTRQIKAGAPCRSERLAKYNRLIRIEEELGDRATYAGNNYQSPCLDGLDKTTSQ